jgi:transposase
MSQFIEGLDRQQTMLLPEHLDDYVDENSPVRAIDAFADMLISLSLASTRSPPPLVGLVTIRG